MVDGGVSAQVNTAAQSEKSGLSGSRFSFRHRGSCSQFEPSRLCQKGHPAENNYHIFCGISLAVMNLEG